MAGGAYEDTPTGFLATTDTTILAALAAGERKRVYLRLSNIGNAQQLVSIFLLKTGESTGDSPQPLVFGPNMPLAPIGKQVIREDWVLGEGDSLVGRGDVANKIRWTLEIFNFNG